MGLGQAKPIQVGQIINPLNSKNVAAILMHEECPGVTGGSAIYIFGSDPSLKDAVHDACETGLNQVLKEQQVSEGLYLLKLKGELFKPVDSVNVARNRLLVRALLARCGEVGYHLACPFDTDRCMFSTALLLRRKERRPMGQGDFFLGIGRTNRIRVLGDYTTDVDECKVSRSLKESALREWPGGFYQEGDLCGSWELRLTLQPDPCSKDGCGPWGASGDNGVKAIQFLLDLEHQLTDLQEGMIYRMSQAIHSCKGGLKHGNRLSLILEKWKGTPSPLIAVSLAHDNLLQLVIPGRGKRAPGAKEQELVDTLCSIIRDSVTACWRPGIKGEGDRAGAREFVLNGSPWNLNEGSLEEALQVRRLTCQLICQMHMKGWIWVSALDTSPDCRGSSVFFFRHDSSQVNMGQPPVVLCLSPHETSQIGLSWSKPGMPDHGIIKCISTALRSSSTFMHNSVVSSENEIFQSHWIWSLQGEPWDPHCFTPSLLGLSLVTHASDALYNLGFKVYGSANVSRKRIGAPGYQSRFDVNALFLISNDADIGEREEKKALEVMGNIHPAQVQVEMQGGDTCPVPPLPHSGGPPTPVIQAPQPPPPPPSPPTPPAQQSEQPPEDSAEFAQTASQKAASPGKSAMPKKGKAPKAAMKRAASKKFAG